MCVHVCARALTHMSPSSSSCTAASKHFGQHPLTRTDEITTSVQSSALDLHASDSCCGSRSTRRRVPSTDMPSRKESGSRTPSGKVGAKENRLLTRAAVWPLPRTQSLQTTATVSCACLVARAGCATHMQGGEHTVLLATCTWRISLRVRCTLRREQILSNLVAGSSCLSLQSPALKVGKTTATDC